jgi:hypothetical protein
MARLSLPWQGKRKLFSMKDEERTQTTRGLDTTALLLLSALGVLAVGVGAGLIYFGYFAPWEFAIWLFVCVAFLAVGLPSQGVPTPRNTKVHGAAQPASEWEAQAAARGDTKSAPMHDQTFPD